MTYTVTQEAREAAEGLHGGILAFRQLNGGDPEMSGHLRSNIQYLEKEVR